MPAVRGSLRRCSRLSHPAVCGGSHEFMPPFAAQPSRCSREFTLPFAAQRTCRSRELTPPFADARRSAACRSAARRWLNARQPAADSSPPDRRWLKPAGSPLTQARRIAADSSSPDCRWLMPAGRRWRGKPTRHFLSSRRRPWLTDPAVRGRSRRRPWGKPTHRRRLPLVRGEGQPAVRGHSARPRLWLPPARRSPPLSGQASRLWSRQPAVAVFDQTVTKVFLSCVLCVFSPGGLLIPLSCPMDFFLEGTKVPAVEAGPRDEATATMDHLPWPPKLPAPPWPLFVCSALEAPSCVCLCVGPEGSPECPPPLPGSTVMARDAPSGRGELCQTSVVCVLCSRLLFPYMVSFLSSFHVIIS